jgi:hypothetical protein
MLTLLPNEQVRCFPCPALSPRSTSRPHPYLYTCFYPCGASVRAQGAPHEGSYTQQLESRVRTLEKEIKAIREAFGEEIKSLREALGRTAEARPQAADTVVAGGHQKQPPPIHTVGSNASGASLQVEGDAISAVKEASRLLVGLVFAESRKQGSLSLFEWSVRVFNDPKIPRAREGRGRAQNAGSQGELRRSEDNLRS